MKKSVSYFLQGLHYIIFVHDMSPNFFSVFLLVPALTGLTVEELEKVCWDPEKPFDNCSFIWNEYSAQGYKTAYGEGQIFVVLNLYSITVPLKNVTRIFSCPFDSYLVENETKSDGNPVIFLANAMKIPWLELVQNPCTESH